VPYPDAPDTNIADATLEKRIRQRAYELYEERLRCTDVDDWLRAECEIADEIQREKSSGVTVSPVIPDVTSNQKEKRAVAASG